MNEGKILQMGPPQVVYANPSSRFVAEFVGEMNFVKGKVIGPAEADSLLGRVRCSLPPSCQTGSEVTLAIRPEHLSLARSPDGNTPTVKGKIVGINYVGDATLFELEVSGAALRVKQPGAPVFAVGDAATIVLPQDAWHVYP
jgi:ABC-type Fe3+/spermidine/putrescine transport system ATPase subunit